MELNFSWSLTLACLLLSGENIVRVKETTKFLSAWLFFYVSIVHIYTYIHKYTHTYVEPHDEPRVKKLAVLLSGSCTNTHKLKTQPDSYPFGHEILRPLWKRFP
jgi:hypothetical protein